jgi:hypothetical protein
MFEQNSKAIEENNRTCIEPQRMERRDRGSAERAVTKDSSTTLCRPKTTYPHDSSNPKIPSFLYVVPVITCVPIAAYLSSCTLILTHIHIPIPSPISSQTNSTPPIHLSQTPQPQTALPNPFCPTTSRPPPFSAKIAVHFYT